MKNECTFLCDSGSRRQLIRVQEISFTGQVMIHTQLSRAPGTLMAGEGAPHDHTVK